MNLIAVLVVVVAAMTSVLGDDLVLPCTSATDCADVPEATCDLPAGKCVCPNGSVLSADMTRCLQVSGGYGTACQDSIQCAVRLLTGGFCSEAGKCECADGYHYLHGRCWKSLGLGEVCASSAQCYANFNNEALSCDAGRCACSQGFYLHAGDTFCRRLGAAPGDDCFFDFDCQFDGGFCREEDKTCELKTDAQVAREYKEINGASKSKVKVKPALVTDGQPTAQVGETCASDAECRAADPNSECSSAGSCWCQRGFFAKSGVCELELGEPCELETDCTHITNGTCRALPAGGAICSCNVYSVPGVNNQRCNRLRPELEINCQSQMETCQNFGPLCSCVILADDDIKCRCDNDSHFDTAAQACWLTKGLGESCSYQEDCAVDSGSDTVECAADGACRCVASYHENKGDCKKDALVFGDSCTDDVDCMFPNGACGNGNCSCAAGYFPSSIEDGAISCLTGVGGACASDEDCHIVENALCNTTASMCECRTDMQSPLVASEIHDACLPVALAYGDACDEAIQCQAAFGADINCTESACACRDNFFFLDQEQTCWQKTALHGKCFSGRDCFAPSGSDRVDCINGFCKCQFQFVEDEETADCVSAGNDLHGKIGALASLIACIFIASLL